MKKSYFLIIAITCIGFLVIGEAYSRGFRGGGGMRGGGMSYGGGRSFHHSPSMGHRTTPSRSIQQRPAQRPSAKPPHASRSGQKLSVKPPSATKPAQRPAKPSDRMASRPSKSDLNKFLGTPSTRPIPGKGDAAKIGAGIAGGALGVEGARKLLEAKQGRPSQLPIKPERPGRPDQPIARPPHKPVKPTHPIARPPHRPPLKPVRPTHPIYRPGKIPTHWWRHAAWGAFAGWVVGASFSDPIYYDYDYSFYYEDEYVYMDGKKVATADEYYNQANQLAENAPAKKADNEKEWLALGVFALSEENSAESNMVLQLAVSKEGVIAGYYYNTGTNSERPIKGMVDKKTQRAVWTFADGKNTDIIMESGLYNLTMDEATALVHFGKDKTQKWRMARLEQPQSGE